MLNTLLTIIIPCKNSVMGLKKTIEDITKKTKIKETRILVLDFGSTDGSYQYAAQASGEFINLIRIESIKMREGEEIMNSFNLVNTPYIMLIKPGSSFKDNDLILSTINELSKINYPIAYLRRFNFIQNIRMSIDKRRRKIDVIFSKKEMLNNLKYNPDNPESDILLIDMSNGIKVGGFID